MIGRQLGISERRITLDAAFVDDLGADSLGLIELTLAFEEQFDIDITDDDIGKLRTVRDAIDFITGKISGPTPARAT